VGLRPLASWDCGFESRWGHGCLSLESVVCCPGRGLCVGLITHPGESYRLLYVCDQESSTMQLGLLPRGKKKSNYGMVDRGMEDFQHAKGSVRLPQGPCRSCHSPSFLFNGSLRRCPWGQSGWAGKITHPPLTPTLQTPETVPPFPINFQCLVCC